MSLLCRRHWWHQCSKSILPGDGSRDSLSLDVFEAKEIKEKGRKITNALFEFTDLVVYFVKYET